MVDTMILKSLEYTVALGMTLGGAYVGNSLARHTTTAEQMRALENEPGVIFYRADQGLDALAEFGEYDFLAPKKENETGIDTVRKGFDFAAKLGEYGVPLLDKLPGLEKWKAKAAEQEAKIAEYKKLEKDYTTKRNFATGAGAGAGLLLTAGGAARFRRKKKSKGEKK